MRPEIQVVKLFAVAAFAAALQITSAGALAAGEGAPSGKKDRPSKVEAIEGSKVKRVRVTEKAAKRLDIQTAEMGKEGADGLSTPYASILYDISGGTWVYTNPEVLTYVRQSVVVQGIKGDKAFLKIGPAAGTRVVTVGVAELYGAEKGVGN
jgi:hypothetical protein